MMGAGIHIRIGKFSLKSGEREDKHAVNSGVFFKEALINTSITAMHFVIAIILSTLMIYREKLNRRRITGILLSMTCILLQRL
jgi:hypothetical protein